MTNISPFKGWRYNNDLIKDSTNVIVPPYDVITDEEQNQYYEKSPFNYIRINLNRLPKDERYYDAADRLAEWKNSGVLTEESQDAIYILSQSFMQNGQMIDRVGCICALELTELGQAVLPHEQTIEKHIDDRYHLMESTHANTGQIFMTYQDDDMILENIFGQLDSDPEIDVNLDDVQYKIWPVTDPLLIKEFQNGMSNKKLVIADGHHRYKTALRYYKQNANINGAEKVMVTVVNSSNPGMNVLPTHRLVSGVTLSIDEIKKGLKPNFKLQEMDIASLVSHMENNNISKGTIGIFHKVSNTSLLLNFRCWRCLNTIFKEQCEASQQLETNILHHFVLNEVFGIDTEDQEKLKKLSYMRGNKPTLKLLQDESGFDVACFVQPPSLDEIFTIAQAGETMPQKSTFFFPKIYSGLVTRCFGK